MAYDFGSIDVYNGNSWSTLATYDGIGPSTFEPVKLDLVNFTGCNEVRMRFRFTSDRYIVDDGWFIDDVEVTAEIPEETTVYGPSFNQTTGTMAQDATQQLSWLYTFAVVAEYRIYTTTLLKPDEYEPNNQTYITIKIVPGGNFHVMLPVSVGWNLASTPLIPLNSSVPEVFLDLDGDTTWTAIQQFIAQNENDPWKSWASTKSQDLNDLKMVDNTRGVWLFIPDNANLGDGFIKLNGTIAGMMAIDLSTGWNLVGYPSLNGRDRDAALNNLDFGTDVDAIWTFDGGTQNWSEMGSTDYFETGRGYWIHSLVDATWDVPP